MKFMEEARKILGGGTLVGSRKDQLKTVCPFCRGNKFYFNVYTGSSSCKSARCEKRFRTVYSLAKALSGVSYMPGIQGVNTASSFDPWQGETDGVPAKDQPDSRLYLRSRRVSEEESDRLNIWAMKKSGALIFPLYNFLNPDEETPYYRRLFGSMRWIGEPGFERVQHCYGAQYMEFPSCACAVVEGIFDLLSPGLAGYGIATLGAEVSTFQMAWLANNFKKVYHLPDNDAGGRKCAEKLQKLCKSYGLEYINWNNKGWLYENTDYSDPGDIPRDHPKIVELRKRIERHNSCTTS